MVNILQRLSPAERANALTHGAGVVLSLVGVGVLAAQARLSHDALYAVAIGVYGLTLVGLYVGSTLCHVATAATSPRLRRLALTLDHVCIYLVIAGTYTPFLLTTLRGMTGLTLLGVVWALGIAGILWKTLGTWHHEPVSVATYLAMGWLVVPALGPLTAAIAPLGLALLLAGGLCYTVGVVFFFLEGVAFAHTVWHLFVLAGSVLHFFTVLFFATPG
jgi:hemolysin III